MTVIVYVPDLPEFATVLNIARQAGNCEIVPAVRGYYQIVAAQEFRLQRKALGIGPALWNSLLCGGYRGTIAEYDRDSLCIKSES